MDSDRKQIEEAVFETALGLDDPAVKQAFLDRVFAGDPDGLARIESLLEAARQSTHFFLEARERSAAVAAEILGTMPGPPPPAADRAAPLPEAAPGTRIGRYQLIKRIGEGGCGVVYEAEQEEPVRRRVALKLIRLGMDTEGVIARFEIERQALALMDHPNIARVLDAGAAENGRPFFVMELVGGERISRYCDRWKLDTPARLALFIQVCQAIQHAHQKGVIHRDIKPSNILVANHDGVAVPKVIDFGIVKATAAGLTGRTLLTIRDQVIGTPCYMSPEQLDMAGMDVDTRGDIYSLGALLYKLLTGRTPFDEESLAASGLSEMRRTLLECEPAAPSARLAAIAGPELAGIAQSRRSEPGKLLSLLRGDLDWIVMKAMEKDRNRRYQTVNSLAMDVRRFIEGRPVLARRPSRAYSLRKLVRRNRAACLSGVAVAISLVGGLGASTWLYVRERQALGEQARLGREAEQARAQEADLRRQAQARLHVARVAMLLSEGAMAEADALLRDYPLESIEPSQEAAHVFRSLGTWNAIYGRLQHAVRAFVLLNQANSLADPRNVLEGFDLLCSAPVFLEAGHGEIYDEFRRRALDRYLPAHNAYGGQHLVKVCMLAPADDQLLARLRPTVEMIAGPPQLAHTVPAWNALALALYHHRAGEFASVLDWCRQTMADTAANEARTAAVHCLAAIAHARLSNPRAAGEALQAAQAIIAGPFEPVINPRGEHQGLWFDWAIARVLLREAEAEIGAF